jgi:hypothetical protein
MEYQVEVPLLARSCRSAATSSYAWNDGYRAELQSPIRCAETELFISSGCPLTVADVSIVPDKVDEVKETSPVAFIANVPMHSIVKWNVFPE